MTFPGPQPEQKVISSSGSMLIVYDDKEIFINASTKAKLKSLLNKPIDLIVHRDFSRKLEQEALQGVEL